MMIRRPRGYHVPAGSISIHSGVAARRIPVAGQGRYIRLVTVDLSDDGIAFPVTFNGSGFAQAQVGPGVSGERWELDQSYVSTSVGALDAALAALFAGAGPVSTLQVANSLAGGGSQFGMGGISVAFGEFIFAQWAGGTPGATAQLRVTGLKTALSQ